jgi:hypothetical protein
VKYPEKPVNRIEYGGNAYGKEQKYQAMAFLILVANLSARSFSINGS